MEKSNSTLLNQNDTITEGRIPFFDNLKLVLITLVVIGHFFETYTAESSFSKSIFFFIYTFHMPLFIFISGYFSKSFMKQKYFRFEKIVSYLIIYIALKLFIFIISRYIFGNPDVTLDFLKEKFIPWYLLSMAFWMSITYIIKRFKPAYVLIISVIAGISAGYTTVIGDFLCASRTVVFLPFFLLGYYIDKTTASSILKLKWLRLAGIISVIALIVFIFLNTDFVYQFRGFLTGRNPYSKLNQPVFGGLFRLFFYILAAVVSLAFISYIPRKKVFFTGLGSRTIQVYFLHTVVLEFFIDYKWGAEFQRQFPAGWEIAILLAAIALTFVLSGKYFEWPFKKIMSIGRSRIADNEDNVTGNIVN